MRRLPTLAAGTLAALVLVAPAAAKGPTSAVVTGPGLDHALPVKGLGEIGVGTPLGSLVELGGFFPEAFKMSPDTTRRTQPTAQLGPRYRVAYRMPSGSGSSTVVQDVYPYAQPKPVTYMRAGQPFWYGTRTHGGWFVAKPGLRSALVADGLPKSPPAATGGPFPWGWTSGGAVAAVVLLLLLALYRRSGGRLRTLKNAV